MITDSISLRNVGKFNCLDVKFVFPESNILVVTGRNGVGKTTIIKSFFLLADPAIFEKSSGEGALSEASKVSFSLSGIESFSFEYNLKLNGLDTKDTLPREGAIVSELPIPYGERFSQFSKIARVDSELKVKIATGEYSAANKLIDFLSSVYSSDKFQDLQAVTIKGREYYFILKERDYYIREDHFSSGEFFLIQLYRLVNSAAKLILIDELDVALDAVAQVNLYSAMRPILQSNESRLIVISHSLAFMNTVDEGALYYLEEGADSISLEARSFGYIKSDLFGFRGYDRYILTEDDVLEGFIEFLIRHYSVSCHYRYVIIGVAGVNQLKGIVCKNDSREIFSSSENVLCVVDGDVFSELKRGYDGSTQLICSPVSDLELFIYQNREVLLNDIEIPRYQESANVKKASKKYWKWLTKEKSISPERLYRLVVDSDEKKTRALKDVIQGFLGQ